MFFPEEEIIHHDVPCTFKGIRGQVVLDQIRTVDKSRLVRKIGKISKPVQQKTLVVLHGSLVLGNVCRIKVTYTKG